MQRSVMLLADIVYHFVLPFDMLSYFFTVPLFRHEHIMSSFKEQFLTIGGRRLVTKCHKEQLGGHFYIQVYLNANKLMRQDFRTTNAVPTTIVHKSQTYPHQSQQKCVPQNSRQKYIRRHPQTRNLLFSVTFITNMQLYSELKTVSSPHSED